ncbi:MAG TPA: hypothetical protein VG498_00860 [Terriglobales bacterium]|nr:hypothetical protein [Terriglobales bacterium]
MKFFIGPLRQLSTSLCLLLWFSTGLHGQFTIGSGNTPQVPDIANEGSGPLDTSQPKTTTPEEIIRKFTAKENEFKQARDQYTWTEDVKYQQLDGQSVMGEFRQVSDIVYDDRGRRLENVKFAPQTSLYVTKEDMDDLRKRTAFSLTTEELPKYQVMYVGQQKVDELQTYVFDIAPKTIEKGQRYFQGRIWVDTQDLQIVKTYGKGVPDIGFNLSPKKKKKHPEDEQLFPHFVTYREQIDGKYWFPTYSKADEVLHFTTGDAHVKAVVKYLNYKRFGSDVKILYGQNDITKNGPQSSSRNSQSAQPK